MKRLLGLLAFLAGGFSTEAVHPLQCDLAPLSRRAVPVTERSRRRTGPDLSGDGHGPRHSPSSL
ncbi:hypothetical protein PI93_015070 [Pandoraea fibrosis]|uniref:Uncharacterized protein n=1 Tax=Pandoraea fibrosis TaxID=1891094 RepID=A0ABX6HSD8_9BURK|nr:hypothetical protein [Pandoraea fibrosis]QHE92628.1 hypothetical protein PJ20_012930 [Pandoraea fibrosis]QHF13816.1 hypothetical protein PI93_015070 [Pandoraea fibrosis]